MRTNFQLSCDGVCDRPVHLRALACEPCGVRSQRQGAQTVPGNRQRLRSVRSRFVESRGDDDDDPSSYILFSHPFRYDAFKQPYAGLPHAAQVNVPLTIHNPLSAVKQLQNELKNVALEVVNYIVDLSADQASALTSLKQDFALTRRFAQCLVVVQDNLTRPDLTGTMSHLQNVQVCGRCCGGAAVGVTLLSGCPCNCVFYHGQGASSTEMHPGRVSSDHGVSLCSRPPHAVLGP